MIRTFAQQEVEDLAKYGSIPVINGLTDYAHPCQVLADLMTIREQKHSFKGLKLCFVGDGNNMANSLIAGCVKVGMKISIACPKAYQPDAKLMQWGMESGLLTIGEDVLEHGEGRGRALHRRVGQHGRRSRGRGAQKGVPGLSGERRRDGRRQDRTPWCSTACPRTAARRSPTK